MRSPIEWKTFDFACAEMKAEDRHISGYASVFGNVDLQNDVVEPGAFADSIAELRNSDKPLKMLWQHYDPIGPWTEFAEDARGLFVSGVPLIEEVQQAREAYALAKARVVDGLSIGYRVGIAERDANGVRHLKKVHLVEASLVTEPANPMARVASVKSGVSVRDMEAVLRDAGLSIKDAKRVAQRVLTDLSPRDADGEDLVERIRALAASIRS